MLSFASDYIEGAHPALLERIRETNFEQLAGYGADAYCANAKEKIRRACRAPHADVFFLVGGTQTNLTVLDALLHGTEGAIAVETGHIAKHEAGAIECTGHKVLTLPAHDGKFCAAELEAYLAAFEADEDHDHMVFPGLVYLSHPTEYGTLYTKAELTELSALCKRFGLLLYLDGARLGYALASEQTDLSLPDIARLCDAFYIGGTKVGALFGEAVVFPHGAPKRFFTTVKQHGALLAKGWLLGVQFDALFTDGLYERLGRHAIETADYLKRELRKREYAFLLDSPTNQQFVLLDNRTLLALKGKVGLCVWEPHDAEHTVVRLTTSWATTKNAVDTLLALLDEAKKAGGQSTCGI